MAFAMELMGQSEQVRHPPPPESLGRTRAAAQAVGPRAVAPGRTTPTSLALRYAAQETPHVCMDRATDRGRRAFATS